MVMPKYPEISDKDMIKLYNLACEIEKIGKKYGLSSIVNIFISALKSLKKSNKNNEQMEFGFISKIK